MVIHSFISHHQPPHRLDGMYILTCACHNGPTLGCLSRWILLLYLLMCPSWLAFCSLISFSVLNCIVKYRDLLEQLSRTPLRFWGFPLNVGVSNLFWGGFRSYLRNCWWFHTNYLEGLSYPVLILLVSSLDSVLCFLFGRCCGSLAHCILWTSIVVPSRHLHLVWFTLAKKSSGGYPPLPSCLVVYRWWRSHWVVFSSLQQDFL